VHQLDFNKEIFIPRIHGANIYIKKQINLFITLLLDWLHVSTLQGHHQAFIMNQLESCVHSWDLKQCLKMINMKASCPMERSADRLWAGAFAPAHNLSALLSIGHEPFIFIICKHCLGSQGCTQLSNWFIMKAWWWPCRVETCSQSNNNLMNKLICVWRIISYLNPLKTKRRLFYLKTQFVPRCKHFSSQL